MYVPDHPAGVDTATGQTPHRLKLVADAPVAQGSPRVPAVAATIRDFTAQRAFRQPNNPAAPTRKLHPSGTFPAIGAPYLDFPCPTSLTEDCTGRCVHRKRVALAVTSDSWLGPAFCSCGLKAGGATYRFPHRCIDPAHVWFNGEPPWNHEPAPSVPTRLTRANQRRLPRCRSQC